MRKTTTCLAAAVAALGAGLATARAAEDVTWAARLDVGLVMRSRWADEVLDAAARPQAERVLRAVLALTGVDLLKDVASVEVAGEGPGDAGGALYLAGAFDRSRLEALASVAEGYAVTRHAGRSIHSWQDKIGEARTGRARRAHAAFAAEGLVVFAQSEEVVAHALDALDGSRAWAPDALRRTLAAGGAFFSAAAKGVNLAGDLVRQTAVLERVTDLALSLSPAGEGMALTLSAAADDEVTASRIASVLEGLRALILLDAANRPVGAALAEGAVIERDGKVVRLTLSASAETLKALQAEGAARAR
jgi:hypothetical protein